jgi:predicted aminopeptidase
MSRRQLALILCLALFAAGIATPKLRYLVIQATFQAELLARRVPIDRAIAGGKIPDNKLAKLEIVDNARAFGASIGLQSTANYETIALGWNHTIWNVSASRGDRFQSTRWWFPITGNVPYLGFFREGDARAEERRLKDRGLDVYVRTAGAYSTLGWFEDPILPHMLTWSEYALASTLLHELAHATLWIPGSIKFNESFANIVGEEAALQYLAQTYAEDSKELNKAKQYLEDRTRFRRVLHDVYKNLDILYSRTDLSKAEVQNRKRAILATLPLRVAEAGFHRGPRYLKAARPARWNNARLMQFKTYNASSNWFRAVLHACDSQLGCFISKIHTITKDSPDPFAALESYVSPLLDTSAPASDPPFSP